MPSESELKIHSAVEETLFPPLNTNVQSEKLFIVRVKAPDMIKYKIYRRWETFCVALRN